ncbi:MAG: P-II family nitrogen regulator, partial [Clostridium sp.]|nr:P-II family nitrogen regulator [Clostridium sp.]
LSKELIDAHLGTASGFSEAFSEGTRLIAKRFFNLIVKDEEVEEAVKIIIEANKTGTPGDGKIFIIPIEDVYRVRDGQNGEEVV